MAKKKKIQQAPSDSPEPQYGMTKILGIWLLAALPFNLLIAVAVPGLMRAGGGSEAAAFWCLLPVNAAWLIGLSLWVIRREEGNLRWETVRRRIWLEKSKAAAAAAKPGCRERIRIPLGVIAAYFALILGLALPSIGAMILFTTPLPAFTNLPEAGSPEFAGNWGWMILVPLVWFLNTFLAEELLFRGVLLPRMKGAFGRMDGVVNAILYSLYYLASPLLIPFRFFTGLAAALIAGGLRSNRQALWVRCAEGAMVITFAWMGVISPHFTPLKSAPALPELAGGGTSPEPVTVQKLDAVPAYVPNSGNPFQVYLEDADLSGLDLRAEGEALSHSCFNTNTVWPAAARLPAGFDPQEILEWGKNPGLGLRALHARGIDGRGVGIAVIDQGLLTSHSQYASRLMWYEEITHNLYDNNTAFHASAVASIAVGKETGVAPGADLYFISSNDVFLRGSIWQMHYIAMSIRRLIELNAYLPEDGKIRVISISIGSNPPGMAGSGDFARAMEEAEAAGIHTIYTNVVPSGYVSLAGAPLLADVDDPKSYDISTLAVNPPENDTPDVLLVPVDSRTLAGPSGADNYFFCRTGGMSWMMPFMAGLYALALQADPDLAPERFWELAFETATPLEVSRDGTMRKIGKLVNPAAVVEAVESGR